MIIGWNNLAKFLGVCPMTVKTSVAHRGLSPGKIKRVGRYHYRVWEMKEINDWLNKTSGAEVAFP
jgi:hypothetical protein